MDWYTSTSWRGDGEKKNTHKQVCSPLETTMNFVHQTVILTIKNYAKKKKQIQSAMIFVSTLTL